MSGFCDQVQRDQSAFAICNYMAENLNYSPSNPITPVDVYAAAIDAAEREEDGQVPAFRFTGNESSSFQFHSEFNSFLATRADMRIPWLFDDLRADDGAEKAFAGIVSKIDTLGSVARAKVGSAEGAEYRRELALQIFSFIMRPREKGGLGVSFDLDQTSPMRDIRDVMAQGKATCVEFTMLYMALARHAGLDARPIHVTVTDEGLPCDHMKAGVVISEGEHLFLDLYEGRVGMAPKEKWNEMSKVEMMADDANTRANRNPRPGELQTTEADWIRGFKRALDFDPDSCIALFNLGIVEYRADRLEMSYKIFSDAEQKCPEDVEIKDKLENVKLLTGR